jgi:flagellum-specific peptidoglycan hydrolase FlgJ
MIIRLLFSLFALGGIYYLTLGKYSPNTLELFKSQINRLKNDSTAFKQSISIDSSRNLALAMDPKELSYVQTIEYIKKYEKVARKEALLSKIPYPIIMGQAIIESNSGKSYLAKNANNHFGIKCFSTKCKKGHCINLSDDSHKDFFLKFTSETLSFSEHSKILKKDRYKMLYDLQAIEDWCYGLQICGYATDKLYANKMIKTIKKFNLN